MTNITVELTEADLLARMKNFEDHLVERKTVKDEKDWKKTAVAFANSVPVGLPAVLYIGVRDNGEIEAPQRNLDEAQKRFNAQMQRVFPRIAYIPKIISENGQQALAVIIPGSELRPHFAGLAYVRRGSETIEASDQQFEELIAQRNSKAGKILALKGKAVTVFNRYGVGAHISETELSIGITVADCNEFWLTLKQDSGSLMTYPMRVIDLSFDHVRDRPRIDINRTL